MATLALAGCGGRGSGQSATQVAAKVNDGEVTVHQVNFILQRTPGLTAEQAPAARKQILERLIDQEVLVQQAERNKLDRDPAVLQALEAARREVLSRAWLDRQARAVPKPDAASVGKFFAENPKLFSERRIYRFDEIVLARRPANWDVLQASLKKANTLAEAASVLRGAGIDAPVAMNVTRASEQLPLNLVNQFATMKVGEVVIYAMGPALMISEIRSITPAPVPEDKSGPLIEQFLWTRDRNSSVESEVKRLRSAAKLEYLGEFRGDAPVPAAAPPTPPAAGSGAPASDRDAAISQGVKGLR